MLEFQWRITKYDPAYRNDRGDFQGGDWTSAWDIGKTFEGNQLTAEEYLRIESAYVNAATSLAIESGVFELTVRELEQATASQPDLEKLGLPVIEPIPTLSEGSTIPTHQVGNPIRLVLRDMAWLKLQTPSFFIHFGQDFYMYIGSDTPCHESLRVVETSGLFVEEIGSPYTE